MAVGNGSFSTLIICRLAGTARNTPSAEITITHGMSHRQRVAKSAGRADGLSIRSAGMAFAIPPLAIAPAAAAVHCIALFSRMPNGLNSFGMARWSAAKMV